MTAYNPKRTHLTASQQMKLTKLESEITYLLDELCTELGFCLPLDEKVKIASNKAINAEQFTKKF